MLRIIHYRPSPAIPRDFNKYRIVPQQLAAQYIDLQNLHSEALSLENFSLYRSIILKRRVVGFCLVCSLVGTLDPLRIVRVHSGLASEALFFSEDEAGGDQHLLTNEERFSFDLYRERIVLFNGSTELIEDSVAYSLPKRRCADVHFYHTSQSELAECDPLRTPHWRELFMSSRVHGGVNVVVCSTQ